jgi:hypothetical protein
MTQNTAFQTVAAILCSSNPKKGRCTNAARMMCSKVPFYAFPLKEKSL